MFEIWYKESYFLGYADSYEEAERKVIDEFGFYDGHELYILEPED